MGSSETSAEERVNGSSGGTVALQCRFRRCQGSCLKRISKREARNELDGEEKRRRRGEMEKPFQQLSREAAIWMGNVFPFMVS
ncbi:UNVERIFIED_CONTAM: hypothetical protein PYX00_001636 [Menopon gallinae]|uniref:Uncharacterized protein n=1 Tax=Menopon gallinae TaxID=328185 RepID=A0AAW2IEY2_9NEOP